MSVGPTRVSITGIDGAGKDTVTKEALTHASHEVDAVKLGRPAFYFSNGVPKQIFKRTTETFDRVHQLGDRFHNRSVIMGLNAANVLTQTRLIEPRVEAAYPDAGLIVSTRDPRLDPAVYFSYYAPQEASKKVDIRKRLETMQKLTQISRDLVIILRVDPTVAVERIDARIAEEAQQRNQPGKVQAPAREKWRHMHENADDLRRLSDGYTLAAEHLQEIAPTQVVEIETTYLDRAAVAEQVVQTIFATMGVTIGGHDTYHTAADHGIQLSA